MNYGKKYRQWKEMTVWASLSIKREACQPHPYNQPSHSSFRAQREPRQ